MNAAIPRSRKMMTSNQIRPIPNIIAIGMSVICIMLVGHAAYSVIFTNPS